MELSFDHHPYGMTDDKEDVSKAMLNTMLCADCNQGLTKFERRFKEEGTLAYYYSKYSLEYLTRVVEYIKEKNRLQLIIDEWHKGIDDKNQMCVNSCHSGMTLANEATQPKIRKVCTDQLERLRKNNVVITKVRRARTFKNWFGKMEGMT